ncbi:36500_t:CDS:2 [Gigaspora margarita]|uniref:36500_t:CDS:1 n=1 Tax=Gigaspora margarita TaxID=4874 RepID=A0ABN7VZT7_GIGMA|nr:36500_t:CDS:2 [Gigaspora margarita]
MQALKGICFLLKLKAVHDSRKTFTNIIAIPAECYNNENMLEPFTALTFSILKVQKINKQCDKNELTIDDIDRIIKLDSHDTNNNEELQGQNSTEFHAHHYWEHNSPITKLKYNILTFRGRKHVCLGRALAINEIKVFLHKILLKYDVSTDHEEIGPKRRYFCPLIALINGGLLFEKRKEIVN